MARSKPRTNKRPPPKAGAKAAFQAAQARAHAEAVEASAPMPVSDAQMQMDVLYANPAYFQGANGVPAAIPTDLPASLAALFEAKLNLDREKAKLVRMQKELRGYRESADRYAAQAKGEITQHAHNHHCDECEFYDDGTPVDKHDEEDHMHEHEDEMDDECTCGRAHYHDEEDEAEEGDEDEYYYYTSEEGDEDDEDDHHHHDCGHEHTCDHEHDQDHEDEDDAQYEENLEMSYTAAFEAYAAERARALAAAEAGVVNGLGGQLASQQQQAWPRKRLAEDPERLDEAVRELFNWIKAVVWTIEQAAGVAQRRGWTHAGAQAQPQPQHARQ